MTLPLFTGTLFGAVAYCAPLLRLTESLCITTWRDYYAFWNVENESNNSHEQCMTRECLVMSSDTWHLTWPIVRSGLPRILSVFIFGLDVESIGESDPPDLAAFFSGMLNSAPLSSMAEMAANGHENFCCTHGEASMLVWGAWMIIIFHAIGAKRSMQC
jgi:hypothetical protein